MGEVWVGVFLTSVGTFLHHLEVPTKNPILLREKRKRTRLRLKLRGIEAKREFFEKNPCCVKCGSTDRIELDHIIQKKHPTNSKIWSRSESYRKRELSLCQVLCYSCHRIKSAWEHRSFKHGRNLYERWGCRCDVCKSAIKEAKQKQRALQKLRSVTSGVTHVGTPNLTRPTA